VRELLQWAREDVQGHSGAYLAFRNHAIPGLLDFSRYENAPTFEVFPGQPPMHADEFGNFIAGYAGYYAGKQGSSQNSVLTSRS